MRDRITNQWLSLSFICVVTIVMVTFDLTLWNGSQSLKGIIITCLGFCSVSCLVRAINICFETNKMEN